MSTQIDLGPVLSIPKGDWDANTTYERLNLVRHNSGAWICNVDTSIGVEPSEDSTDWFLQVRDTSAVSSVNGMKGDVEITTIQTPSNDSNDTSITNTEWVRARINETINSTNSYTDEAISDATTSILDAAAQNASDRITIAVNQVLASSDARFATKESVEDLVDYNTSQDTAITAAQSTANAAQTAANAAQSSANSKVATINGEAPDSAGNVQLSVSAFPAGTKMLFNQSAAPTGWTKQTSVDNAALRVVSGTSGGDTGGSIAFSTLFATGKTVSLSGNVGATTLTVAQMPSHSHNVAWYGFTVDSDGANGISGDRYHSLSGLYHNATSSTGGSSSHTHSLSGTATIALNVKYTDVIICAKD